MPGGPSSWPAEGCGPEGCLLQVLEGVLFQEEGARPSHDDEGGHGGLDELVYKSTIDGHPVRPADVESEAVSGASLSSNRSARKYALTLKSSQLQNACGCRLLAWVRDVSLGCIAFGALKGKRVLLSAGTERVPVS